ncbi:MAG: hemerythrin family protein [Firmicutes bacterium]|nr:hemerythrin family protein [Bacillota bacterium]
MLWSKNYETGNINVDGQHKELFRLVQQVLDADAFSDTNEIVETVVGFLSDYAVRHFAAEEALMLESDYPLYSKHKLQHDDFVKEVVLFINRLSAEGSTISISETINGFVIEWLKSHIMGSDKAMADFYKEWEMSKN